MNYQIFAGLPLQVRTNYLQETPTKFIANLVCNHIGADREKAFKIKPNGRYSQEARHVYPRHLTYYLAYKVKGATLNKISLKQHHVNVIKAIQSIKNQIETDVKVRNHVEQLTKILNLSK